MSLIQSLSGRCRPPFTELMLILFTVGGGAVSRAAQAPRSRESRVQPAARLRVADADAREIRKLIAEYAKSIDMADTHLASQVWWDSPEVTFIHPLGWEHGFEEIKQEVYQRLMGGTFSERNLIPHDIVVHIHRNSAWAEFYWDFHARLRKDGSSITTHGRETQVYWKIKGRWRLVHVHYSGLPPKDRNNGF